MSLLAHDLLESGDGEMPDDSSFDGETIPENQKSAHFDVKHHPINRMSYEKKIESWTESVKTGRCQVCWLRDYDCYCPTLEERKKLYEGDEVEEISKVKVCMYYHYQEIGRSANTAHLFEALCPSATEVIIFGDVEKEQQLVRDIKEEYDNGEPITCILYPDRSAVLLSEWISKRPSSCSNKPVRMVALDGTYGNAARQWKYLRQSLQQLDGHVPLPVVKLDLELGKCNSAIAGIMHQPGKEKICTYQAVIMAMRQAGESESICASLATELDHWLLYILQKKIKFGKSRIKQVEDFHATPSDLIMEHLMNNPPPRNSTPKIKGREGGGRRRAAGGDNDCKVEEGKGGGEERGGDDVVGGSEKGGGPRRRGGTGYQITAFTRKEVISLRGQGQGQCSEDGGGSSVSAGAAGSHLTVTGGERSSTERREATSSIECIPTSYLDSLVVCAKGGHQGGGSNFLFFSQNKKESEKPSATTEVAEVAVALQVEQTSRFSVLTL